MVKGFEIIKDISLVVYLESALTLYLSVSDFWHSQGWNFEFDELDFFPSLNVQAGKIQYKLGKKSSLSNWKVQTWECQKSIVDK